MKRKQEVRTLRRLAKKLFALHGQSSHISRADNNALFETARQLDAMGDRVEVKYDPAQLTILPRPVSAEDVQIEWFVVALVPRGRRCPCPALQLRPDGGSDS